jgi:hypothetical protein
MGWGRSDDIMMNRTAANWQDRGSWTLPPICQSLVLTVWSCTFQNAIEYHFDFELIDWWRKWVLMATLHSTCWLSHKNHRVLMKLTSSIQSKLGDFDLASFHETMMSVSRQQLLATVFGFALKSRNCSENIIKGFQWDIPLEKVSFCWNNRYKAKVRDDWLLQDRDFDSAGPQ